MQERAGQIIAEITGADAGYVTCGAAAALALAAAACMTRLDPSRINQLPDVQGMPHEIILQRTQRYDYDHALRSVGARLVEVGFPDLTFPYEIERAINPLTAAIAYYPTPSRPALPLAEVVEIAHRHQVPVIVDAAMELPPDRWSALASSSPGADLVAYSGGKAIRGPQASGFLCGRADLIRAVALNHQDMDVRPATWGLRARVASGEIIGPPHHGIGRTMKVGKEEIVGLIVALQRFVGRDEAAELAAWRAKIEYVAAAVTGIPGVEVEILDPSTHAGGRPHRADPTRRSAPRPHRVRGAQRSLDRRSRRVLERGACLAGCSGRQPHRAARRRRTHRRGAPRRGPRPGRQRSPDH